MKCMIVPAIVLMALCSLTMCTIETNQVQSAPVVATNNNFVVYPLSGSYYVPNHWLFIDKETGGRYLAVYGCGVAKIGK